MGRQTGTVVGQTIEVWQDSDIPLRLLSVDLLGSKPETVEWFDITGEDTAPVNGDRVVVWEIAENYKLAILTKDLITAAVSAGERKFYSRDSAGAVKAIIYLKNDGNIAVDGKDVEFTATGKVDFIAPDDFTIKAGDLIVENDILCDGDVFAKASSVPKSLDLHPHLGNLAFNTGPSLNVGGGVAPPGTPPVWSFVDNSLDMGNQDIKNVLGITATVGTHKHSQGVDGNNDIEADTDEPL